MLSPLNRTRAIDLLCRAQANAIGYSSSPIINILRDGFKGYASFSDQQLLNSLQSFVTKPDAYSNSYNSSNSHTEEIKRFLSELASEKFLLE